MSTELVLVLVIEAWVVALVLVLEARVLVAICHSTILFEARLHAFYT